MINSNQLRLSQKLDFNGQIRIRCFLVFLLATNLISFSWWAYGANSNWGNYTISDEGFVVSMPNKPQSFSLPNPSKDGTLVVYRADEESRNYQFSIFVGRPEKRGIFERESHDAYLDGHLKGLLQGIGNGKVEYSRRVTFQGMPAMEYRIKFSHPLEKRLTIGRGVTFMIDGGHMRLSMWYPDSDINGVDKFDRFVKSFKLVPIRYQPAESSRVGSSMASFMPPAGWARQPSKNQFEVARYNNLTRSLVFLSSGNSNYSCSQFVSELRATGRISEASQVVLGGQRFSKTVMYEDVLKYNVRLTNIYYCRDSGIGALVLSGSEEQNMFWRWAPVFEGAAASIGTK